MANDKWGVIGADVFGQKGENQSAASRLLSLGDQDATYDMLSKQNPSDSTVAAARESFMQNVDAQRAEQERRAQEEAAAQYGGGNTYNTNPTQNAGTPSFTPKANAPVDTSEFDNRIKQLEMQIQQAQRTGIGDVAYWQDQLSKVREDRDKYMLQAALSRSDNFDSVVQNMPEANRAAARQRTGDPFIRTYGEAEKVRTIADIQNDLYAAQGRNDQGAVEALQRELAQATNSRGTNGRAAADAETSALKAEVDKAQSAVDRASVVYNQAADEYNASRAGYYEARNQSHIANANTLYYNDAYKQSVNQLNALIQQYKACFSDYDRGILKAGVTAEDAQILFDALKQAETDVNVLRGAVETRNDEASVAGQIYRQAAEALVNSSNNLVGASSAMYYNQERLSNSIGLYYDAVNEKDSLPSEYKEAYEQVQGLDVLISGYERKLENVRAARIAATKPGMTMNDPAIVGYNEEAAALNEKLRNLREKRAQYYPYAYEYDLQRTLSEMSEEEFANFQTITEYLRNSEFYSASSEFATKARGYERRYMEEYGENKYRRILDMVEREEGRRQRAEQQQRIQNMNVGESIAASLGSVITNLISMPGVLAEIAVQSLDSVDAPINTNANGFRMQNLTRDIRGGVGQKIEQSVLNAGGTEQEAHWAGIGYSTVMSGIDSLVAMFTGNAIGAGLGLSGQAASQVGGYLLGANAASNSMEDIIERGGKPEEAIIGGVVAGVFECLFETWSIEKFKALQEKEIKNGILDILGNLGKSALTNFSEEFNTEIANIGYDILAGALGMSSEWEDRFNELKDTYQLSDSQAYKVIASEIATQAIEAGASGALMGVGLGGLSSIKPYINYASLRSYVTNGGNYTIAERYSQLLDANALLMPENRIEIPSLTSDLSYAEMAGLMQQILDAQAKQNVEARAQAEDQTAVSDSVKTKAQEIAAVNVHTNASIADVNERAEAGAEAGRADAANAQEDARIAQNDVSRETAGNTAEAETEQPDEAQREAVPMDDEYAQDLRNTAETTLDNLEGAFSGDVLRANVEDQMQEWRETEGQIGEDKAAALENLYNERYNNSSTDETVSPAIQGNPSAEQNTTISQTQTNTLTADEQGTVDRTVESIMAAATNADGSIDVEVARDLSQNGTIQFRDDGRGYIADAIINGVETRIAGGNESGEVYSDESGGRVARAYSAGSGSAVEGSAGSARIADESGESGRQNGTAAGTSDGGTRVDENAPTVRMSELDAANGAKGDKYSVYDVTKTTTNPSHKALLERADADGIKLRLVKGPLTFEVQGGLFTADGFINTQTGEVIIRVDSEDFTPEQLYDHEVFHKMARSNPAMYDEVRSIVESKYGDRLSSVLDRYRENYAKLNYSDERLTEELCADVYAGMERDAQGQAAFTAEVREIVNNQSGEANQNSSGLPKIEYSVGYTTDGDKFVDVQNDILSGVAQNDWVRTVKNTLSNLFPNGIKANGQYIKVNRQTRREVTESKYSKYLRKFDQLTLRDKFRAMANADELVKYAENWVEEEPTHPRTDNIVRFATADVLMRIGNQGYDALVVVATTNDGSAVLYDLIDLIPTNIVEKQISHTAAPLGVEQQNRRSASVNRIPQGNDSVNSFSASFSASSTDDLIDAIEAGEREADNGKDATTKQKAGAVSAGMTLDERAQAAYDKALANGDKARAEEISKMRAAQHKASDLRRETRMAKAAYERSGSTEDFVRYNNLRNESNRANREYRNLANRLGDEMAAELTPKQAIRRTENLIIDEFHVPSGFRAQSRKAVRDLLNQIYADGEINETDVDRVIRSLFDIGTEYTQPDPVYASIRDELRGQRIYVDPSTRAEYGDDWANTRQRFFAHGVYLVSDMSKADPNATVDSVYTGMTGDYPAQMPETNTDGRAQLDAMLDALDQGRVTGQNYFEALAESQNMSIDDVYDLVYEKVSGILNEYGRLADIETHIHQRSDAEMLEAKTRFNEKTEMARERRSRVDALRKIDNILSRIYKRAKENDASFTRVANEQDSVMRERMEDALNKLNSVAVSMFGFDITDSARLAEWMDQYAKSYAGFDPSGSLREAAKTLSEIGSGDTLTVEDLDFLYDMLRRIDHALAMANEMMDDSRGLLGGVAEDMRDQTKALRGVKKYVTNLRSRLRPIFNEESLSYARNLRRYGGWNPHSVMAWVADRAERSDMDYMKYKVGADMVLQPFLNRRNNEARRNWLYKAAGKNAEFVDVEIPKLLADGTASPGETMKIRVNQMMLVQMYLDLRNEDNLRHIEYGGYTIPDEQMYKKGQNKQAYDSGTKNVRMTAATMQRIVNENLAAEGKEFAELLDKYYNEYAKPLINATSRAIDGVDKAVNPHYYPIRNDKNYHASSYNIYNGTLENMGPLKERVKGARNAIYLADADETFQWHKELMAKYTGYAKLLRDFKALMNFDAGGDMTNEAVLVDKFGQGARQFVSNFFENLETGKIEDAKTLSKIMGNYISSVLNANISSMLKQFAALPLAGSTYGMEPITYAIAHMGRRVDPNFVRKYTAYLDERADTMTYDQITDIVRKKAGSVGAISKAVALGRNWLEATDYTANKMMWIAAEHYVDTHFAGLQKGTQEDIDNGESPYYKKVAQVFDKMTFDTQTNANTMSKPDILRRVDSGIKAFTLFKTDAFQVQGIIREAVGQYRWAKQNGDAADVKAAGQKLYHALQGVFVSSVVQAMMAAIAKVIRRRDDEFKDEDGNLDFGKVGKRLAIDTGENIFGSVLFGSTLYTWIWSLIDKDEKFYDIEAASLSVVTDLLAAIGKNGQKIFETLVNWNAAENKDANFWEAHKDDLLKPIYNLAKQISTFVGIPWANIEKNLIGWLGMAWAEVAVAISDEWTEYDKTSLEGKHGKELEARMKAYISDELGIVSDAMLAEYVRLYEVFGEDLKPSLPSANEPTVYDEDGKKRDLTPEEYATWDSAYRTTMIDLVNDFAESESFMSLTDDEKKTVLEKALKYAKEVAKGDIGLKTASYVGKVQNATENGADMSNVLLYYALQAGCAGIKDDNGKTIDKSKLLNQFKALEDMDIPDEQKAAIYHAMYQSTGSAWKDAAATMNDQEFLAYAREQFADIQAKVDKKIGTPSEPKQAAAPTIEPQTAQVEPAQAVSAPEPEQPKADPLQPEYDKAVSAGMSEDGAKAAVQAVKAAGGDEAKERAKQAAAVGVLDSVEDQLAAVRYYSEKPEANYARFSRANDYGVTPADFFSFWGDLSAKYDTTPKQTEAQAILDSRTDLTQEQKAAMWQLCGANWSASKNPYAVYVGDQVREAYYAND